MAATKTDNGFTIAGTPTSDVNITLPAATVLPKSAIPEVTISKTATSITATVTNHEDKFGEMMETGNKIRIHYLILRQIQHTN